MLIIYTHAQLLDQFSESMIQYMVGISWLAF